MFGGLMKVKVSQYDYILQLKAYNRRLIVARQSQPELDKVRTRIYTFLIKAK